MTANLLDLIPGEPSADGLAAYEGHKKKIIEAIEAMFKDPAMIEDSQLVDNITEEIQEAVDNGLTDFYMQERDGDLEMPESDGTVSLDDDDEASKETRPSPLFEQTINNVLKGVSLDDEDD